MHMLFTVLRVFWRVLMRRLFGKRRHPNWSLPYEVGVDMCGSQMSESVELPSTPGGQRANTPPTPISPGVARRIQFATDTLAGLPTEVHTPKDLPDAGRTLLYIHGGGYIVCNPGTHRALIARLSLATKARTVAIDYRKAPEHPFPAAIDDCVAAYRALIDQGVEPRKLALAGDSAGGGLILALLQRLRDDGLAQPAAVVLLSPWVDLTAEGGSLVDNIPFDYLPAKSFPAFKAAYLGNADPAGPLVSAVNADLAGLPPMFVTTGTHELFFDQDLEFVKRAVAAGVDVTHDIGPDQVHVYPLLADVSGPARDSIRRIGEFVRGHTSGA